MTQIQRRDSLETIDQSRGFRRVIQDFAAERTLCDRFVRAGKLDEAEQALERVRRLHEELLVTADQRNSIHRSMVRNRRVDLSLLCGQVENCRLKKQAAALRRRPRRTVAPTAEGA